MLSKIISAALVAASLAQGCSNSTSLTDGNHKTEIGRRPEFFSTSYLFRAGDANSLTFVDRKGKTVQLFQLDPFEHRLTLPLPFSYDKQGVLAAGNGEYFVAIGEDEYAIMKRDGTTNLNPVGLAGRIESAAFDPVHHYLLVADEFKSMALMVLTPSGDVAGSWTAGNLFPGDKTVLAGTMLDDGRLVLSVGETGISVVDFAETVAGQAWSYTSFDVPDAKAITWLASVPDHPDNVMAYDTNSTTSKNRYLSLDLAAKTVADQVDVTDQTVLGRFRDYSPHAIFRSVDDSLAGKANVIFVGDEGKFAKKPVSYTGQQITQTWLDPSTLTLTLAFDSNKTYDPNYEDPFYFQAQDIFRIRLTDSFVDKSKVDEVSAMAITPNYLVLLFPSYLGKAERLTYGKTPTKEKLEGYNLELFRDRYKAKD